MQGLKSSKHTENIDHWQDEAASMLVENDQWHTDLITQVVDWFETISRTEEQSFEAAVKSKYDTRAARLYTKLRLFDEKQDNAWTVIEKTVHWFEHEADEDGTCDCIEDAILDKFGEEILRIYYEMKASIGIADDGPQVKSLTLPSAKLKLRDGALQKMGSEAGTVVASFPVETLNGLWIRKSWSFAMPFLWTGLMGALSAISQAYIPYKWLGWMGAASFAAGAVYNLMGLRNNTIVVDTEHGMIEYPTADRREDIESFVMSVRQEKANAGLG